MEVPDFPNPISLLRAELTAELELHRLMIHQLGTDSDQRFNWIANRFDETAGQMGQMAGQMRQTAGQMRQMAVEMRQMNVDLRQMNVDLRQMNVELRQMNADSQERFNQLSGRSRLTEQRVGTMLGAVDQERTEWRACYSALDQRVSELERRLPPAS